MELVETMGIIFVSSLGFIFDIYLDYLFIYKEYK